MKVGKKNLPDFDDQIFLFHSCREKEVRWNIVARCRKKLTELCFCWYHSQTTVSNTQWTCTKGLLCTHAHAHKSAHSRTIAHTCTSTKTYVYTHIHMHTHSLSLSHTNTLLSLNCRDGKFSKIAASTSSTRDTFESIIIIITDLF